jgi:hypothetical protein
LIEVISNIIRVLVVELAYDDGERRDEDGEGEGGADAAGDGDAALALDVELQEGDHGPEEPHVHDAQQFHGENLRSVRCDDRSEIIITAG